MTPDPGKATANPTAAPASVNLAEVLDVIRPQVEKIEKGFKAHPRHPRRLGRPPGASPGGDATENVPPAAVSREPAPPEERRPTAEPKAETAPDGTGPHATDGHRHAA